MTAARQKAFSSSSRNAAYASISANFKKMFPDADREERLGWIANYLGIADLDSMTDLTDDQLGAVAGEMKRLTGSGESRAPALVQHGGFGVARLGNVVQGEFGKASSGDGDGETVFLSSPEMVYTLEKLIAHVGWGETAVTSFLYTRYSVRSLRMLTFEKARKAVNQFLHIAAHRDLKKQHGDAPVSRKEVEKYIPILKRKLQIDQ